MSIPRIFLKKYAYSFFFSYYKQEVVDDISIEQSQLRDKGGLMQQTKKSFHLQGKLFSLVNSD